MRPQLTWDIDLSQLVGRRVRAVFRAGGAEIFGRLDGFLSRQQSDPFVMLGEGEDFRQEPPRTIAGIVCEGPYELMIDGTPLLFADLRQLDVLDE